MPRLQHAVAIAMVLVAAIALGSSTYAWFVSNNNVTANTSSISAQSNAPFLVIKAGSAVTTDTITTDATTDPVANKVLFPVQMVKAEDNASAFQWESAYASASTAADEKASTRFIVQSADYNKYYMKETFYVGTNGTTKGQFKNLRVSGVTATPGSESEELKNALRVMVVCGEEVAIYDQKGTLVTTYVKQGDSNTPKRRIVWRCSDKYSKAHEKCHTPALDIEVIKDAFVRSLNEKLEHRDEVLENLKEIRNLISGGERTLQQQTALWEESRLLEEQIQALIMQNARIAMDQEQYKKEFDELVERHSRVKQEYEEQAIAAEQDVGRVAQIDYFISTLEELNAPVTEFDEQLWISMVDHVVVHSKEDIRVVYRLSLIHI